MSTSIFFQWNKPIPQIIKETTGGDATARFMAVSWHRLYDQFVPMDSGTLAHDDIEYEVKNGVGYVHHTAPYAHRMYTGAGFNFSKEQHVHACAFWDQAAKQAGKASQLALDVMAFIKRGG